MEMTTERSKERTLISQKDNFQGNFGEVLRSSAIFYYFYGPNRQTTISLLNYWPLKRDLDVTVLATFRDLSGALIRRERIAFDKGQVVNYRPTLIGRDEFEGSVEIEVFSLKNLVIPYAAVMVIYESETGISMVHSYGRTYSRHEVEEKRTICVGEESCWTLRDSDKVRSFGVFHNGGSVSAPQLVRLSVTNAEGDTKTTELSIKALAPYETFKVYPSEQFHDLAKWMNGKPAQARISFKLSESFTRMLVANESIDGRDIQVTHSNFNYSAHITDQLETSGTKAFMVLPSIADRKRSLLVYPDCDPGEYDIDLNGRLVQHKSGAVTEVESNEGNALISFSKAGSMPTRLVTAMVLGSKGGDGDVIPNECSLGVTHSQRPPKRMWWGSLSLRENVTSRMYLSPMEQVYGPVPADLKICIRLFSSDSQEFQEAWVTYASLGPLDNGIDLRGIFPNLRLNGDFGYYTFYGEYGGFIVYSTLEKPTGSMCFEHGF